jgi:hypothetical protein
MAAATVWPAMSHDGDKTIHAFFRKTDIAQLDGGEEQGPKVKRTRKSKAAAEPEAKGGKKQKTLQQIVNPQAVAEEVKEVVRSLKSAVITSQLRPSCNNHPRRESSYPHLHHGRKLLLPNLPQPPKSQRRRQGKC